MAPAVMAPAVITVFRVIGAAWRHLDAEIEKVTVLQALSADFLLPQKLRLSAAMTGMKIPKTVILASETTNGCFGIRNSRFSR